MSKVYVVMSNDFPYAVCRHASRANEICAAKMAEQDRDPTITHAPRIYYRDYDFEIDETQPPAQAIEPPDALVFIARFVPDGDDKRKPWRVTHADTGISLSFPDTAKGGPPWDTAAALRRQIVAYFAKRGVDVNYQLTDTTPTTFTFTKFP